MRVPLLGITLRLDGIAVHSSSTVATVGAQALVLASTAPELALTLTSTYLAGSDGALAISHLHQRQGHERLHQHSRAATDLHATLAGACLLDHAAALRELADRSDAAAHVAVDIDHETLDQVATTWGPALPS